MKTLTALMLSAAVISCASVIAVPAAAAATQQGGALAAPAKVTSVEGITEYRLGNGMRVLLFPDASKPTLTTNIVYMVGSRHENYGETGMAHLLEHLLFKPSKNFSGKNGHRSPVEVLNATGADFNGTTWYDRTNYYATFPANEDNLKMMLELEADRMVNANIDQNDLWNPVTKKGEMTVVRNEFEMGESDPIGVTSDRIQAVAFDWHNYGKSTIGARSDIEQVNIPRLKAFYKNYYQPDNAALMVAGRFDEAKILKQINALFGRIPKPARVIAPTYTAEPTQDGERAVTVRRSGGTQFIGAGYHVAPSGHFDAAALRLLGRILVDAPSGRLYKALVETKLASRLEYDPVSNLEPGYRILGAVVPKELPLDVTQAAMIKAIENLKAEPITPAEVARAKQAVNAQIELATNDTARLTIALTESMAAGDWRLFFVQRDQIEKVDAAAVQAVADKYFKASNRTLGRFIPTDAPDRAEVPGTPDIAALVDSYKGRAVVAQGEAFDPKPDNIEKRTERFTLAGGMKAALLHKTTKGGAVSATLMLRMGTAESLTGKAQAGTFAAALMIDGTERLSRQEVRDAFNKLKARVNIVGGAEGVRVTVTTTRENLPATLDLVAEVLQKPAYAAPEFQEFQLAQINRAEQNLPEPQPLAFNAYARLIDATPQGHVRHALTLPEQLAQVKTVKREDVKAFHDAFYGAENAHFSAVGDFDAPALKAQLGKLFGSWKSKQPYVRIPDTVKDVASQKMVFETPDKANSVLMAVQPIAMKDDAPAYPALVIANHMLGGGALRSRLADRIRQKEGLSYGVQSWVSIPAREAAGHWAFFAICAPQNTAKVEAAMQEELARAIKDGFSESELAEAKKGWLQGQEVERNVDASLATTLSQYLEQNRSMAYDKDLETKVAALTVAQVNAALRDYVKPATVSLISAGDFAKGGREASAKK